MMSHDSGTQEQSLSGDAVGVPIDAPAPPTNPAGSVGRGAVSRLRAAGLSRFTGLGIWALLVLIFALWVPSTFLTVANAQSIASTQAITAVLAIGVLPTLAAGVYDLSAAQNLGLAAVISGSLMVNSHVAPVLAVLITLAAGAGVGALNGIVIAVIGVDSFIATLRMSSVLLAVTEKISKDQFVGPLPSSIQTFVSHQPLGIPIVTVYALVIAVLVWYVLEHTPVGRRTFATGLNRDAARLTGVRTARYVFGSCVVTGTIAALAGVLAAAQFGEVDNTLGPPYLLPVFAAAFLGTTQIKPGRFNVWGTIVALYLISTGIKGLQLAGAQLWVTDLFYGVALLVAVSLAVISHRRRRTARAAAEPGS